MKNKELEMLSRHSLYMFLVLSIFGLTSAGINYVFVVELSFVRLEQLLTLYTFFFTTNLYVFFIKSLRSESFVSAVNS